MAVLKIDPENITGRIKPMHSINNGPIRSVRSISNAEIYTAAGFPYARTHDASFQINYGGEHTVDISAVFPDFDADENDPASYDFHFTDEYMQSILDTGTRPFYRLGQRIEHESKKYYVFAPKDFGKWARICEHLIRHLNEGWADGHHFGIEYWEIWNEPDLNPQCFIGTKEEYFELYRTAAVHLKKCFPNLKIGGPALTNVNRKYAEAFLSYIRACPEKVPLDFYSWHTYTKDPHWIYECCTAVRGILDSFGYKETESILDEWNYVAGWFGEKMRNSYIVIRGMKGAAFTAAVMLEGQAAPLDHLMYYDARPCPFCGLFDPCLLDPYKGYWPFPMFNRLYSLGDEIKVSGAEGSVYACAARGGDSLSLLVVRYSDDDTLPPEEIAVELPQDWHIQSLHVLDEKHDNEEITAPEPESGVLHLTLENLTVMQLEFVKN